MPDFFAVGKTDAILVAADPTNQKRITNNYGGKLYYKTASDVDTGDTEVAVGSGVTTDANLWIISETESKVSVETLTAPTHQDLTVSDDATIADDLTVSGTGTFTEGIASSSAVPGFYAGNWNPVAATSGTDTTPAEKKLFVSSLFLPVNKTIKGVGYLVGSVGGTDKAVAGLFSSSGALLANSSQTTEGATVGTAAEIQELDFTATYAAKGPGVYFVGITMNGNTARLRTIPKNTAGANVFSKEITIATKNTLAAITAPTAFEADKGPVAWVY